MSIRIVRRGREFQKTIEGTTFILRRPTPEQEQALIRQYSRRGLQPDFLLLGIAKLELAIVGWDQVIVDAQPIGYEKALIKEFPDSVRSELLDALNEGADADFTSGSRPTSPPSSGTPSGEPRTPA